MGQLILAVFGTVVFFYAAGVAIAGLEWIERGIQKLIHKMPSRGHVRKP